MGALLFGIESKKEYNRAIVDDLKRGDGDDGNYN